MGAITATLVILAAAPGPVQAEPLAGQRRPIQVGTLTLDPCATSDPAWCEKIQVPFDHTDASAGTTGLYFEWYPATNGSAAGTVLTTQGGPGYPSTDYRDDYLKMLGPLTATRNVLIVDLRGTGGSDALVCNPVQNWKPANGNQAHIDAVGKCGDKLNTTRTRPDGSWVRGADLYTTANAAP